MFDLLHNHIKKKKTLLKKDLKRNHMLNANGYENQIHQDFTNVNVVLCSTRTLGQTFKHG